MSSVICVVRSVRSLLQSVIGVCTDTYVFYQSVLEKRPIGQVYHKECNVMSQRNITDIILQNDLAGPSDFVCNTDASGL